MQVLGLGRLNNDSTSFTSGDTAARTHSLLLDNRLFETLHDINTKTAIIPNVRQCQVSLKCVKRCIFIQISFLELALMYNLEAFS